MQDLLIFIIDEILESGSKMRNARTVIAGVLCALMICCMLGNAYTVKGKEMLLAPENKETKDQNTENSKIEDNNTENEEELNKGAKKGGYKYANRCSFSSFDGSIYRNGIV